MLKTNDNPSGVDSPVFEKMIEAMLADQQSSLRASSKISTALACFPVQ